MKKGRYKCFCCGVAIYKKDTETCSICKNINCLKDSWTYTDESNEAITKNSPIICTNCKKIRKL